MVCSDLALLASPDICGACRLSEEAGWNQTAEDWNIFIDHGSTFGIRRAGALVATAAALPYGSGFGFVSMVLGHPGASPSRSSHAIGQRMRLILGRVRMGLHRFWTQLRLGMPCLPQARVY